MIRCLEKPLFLHIRHFMVLIFVGLAINGCVNLKPQQDPTRYFVLSGPASEKIDESGYLHIAIERIDLPSYLKSPKIATKISGHEIAYAEHFRWTEELETSVARIIRDRLRLNSKIKTVTIYPGNTSAKHDYSLRLNVHQFEGDHQGNVTLSADWRIVDKAGIVMESNTARLTSIWDGSDYTQLVERMNEILLQLCSTISELFNNKLKG